jgi:predicted phosphodiesterase
VRGNCDIEEGFRETEVAVLGGRKFVLRHIVGILRRDDQGRGRARGVEIPRPGTGKINGAR